MLAATPGGYGSRWRDLLRQKSNTDCNSTISLTAACKARQSQNWGDNLLIARKVGPRLPPSTERLRSHGAGGGKTRWLFPLSKAFGGANCAARSSRWSSPSTEARVEGLVRRRHLPGATNALEC